MSVDAWAVADPCACPVCGSDSCDVHLPASPAPPVLAAILDDVRVFLMRYVVLTTDQATVIALWMAMTHVIDAFDFGAYLQVTSATPESGKTRLLDVLRLFVRRPWYTARVSAAVLVRKVDAEHPTLLLDESDAAFQGEKEYAEALRGILNTGYARNGTASLCVGQGKNIAYKDFSTFCPKAIAGIGKLPDTVMSRSIRIVLRRRDKKTEPVKKFRERDATTIASPIQQALVLWGNESTIETLRAARPSMPDGLRDRAEDVAEPLIAIADVAGVEWASAARTAIVALMGSVPDEDKTIELLRDIRDVFTEGFSGATPPPISEQFIRSEHLIKRLSARTERPWGTCTQGKPITVHKLAALLKPFGIEPVQNKTGTGRGYYRDRFLDAWSRYLSVEVSRRQDPNKDGVRHANSECQGDRPVDTSQSQETSIKPGSLDTLTLQGPWTRDGDDDGRV
jgi:hypothetical protein